MLRWYLARFVNPFCAQTGFYRQVPELPTVMEGDRR